jgi:biopolymer transport protein ExbD
MKSLAIKTLRSDNFLVIVALLLAIVLFTAGVGKTQQLQPGVSVQLPTTTGAASVPEADNADAWIVTVTENNDLYFGVDPITPQGLLDAMKIRPRIRGQELYIKADGRASFSAVAQVLKAARADLFQRVVLLTGQSSGPQPGTIVPPKGLSVWMDPAAASEAIVVHIDLGQAPEQALGQGSPTLRIDNQEVSLLALQHKLEQLLQGRSDGVVILKPGKVPFADVAHVVDVCNMSGAKPVLGTPEL